MRVDYCLGLGQVRKRVLRDLSEALTALSFFTNLEVDLGHSVVILGHNLLILAPSQVKLDTGPLLLLLKLVESLLENANELLIHRLIINRLRYLSKVNQFELLFQ